MTHEVHLYANSLRLPTPPRAYRRAHKGTSAEQKFGWAEATGLLTPKEVEELCLLDTLYGQAAKRQLAAIPEGEPATIVVNDPLFKRGHH